MYWAQDWSGEDTFGISFITIQIEMKYHCLIKSLKMNEKNLNTEISFYSGADT